MNHIHPNLHHRRRRSGRPEKAQGNNDNPIGIGGEAEADGNDARISIAPVEQSPPSENNDETDSSLMNLFSSTLRSLVADAAAIRQLSDMADLLQQEQNNNTTANNSPALQMAAELVRLDDLVTGFEHKVEVLRQIINEETKALTQFETTLRDEADDQAALIEGLMETLQLYENDQPQQNQQQQVAMEHEIETRSQGNSETNDSFSSMGSSSIHNSIHNNNNTSYTRQSLANTINDSGSWDEEDLMTTTTPTQRQPHVSQRSSMGSNASSITIRSNESGSFTRRSGLLRSTRFSSGNTNASNNNANNNANNNSNTDVSSSSRQAATNRKSSYKKTVVFKDVDASFDETNENNAQHHDSPKQPSFVPVTDQELGRRTLFGPHMCRYDINEALEEIQSVVWNQLTLLETSFRNRKSGNSKRQSGSSYRGQNDSKHNNNNTNHRFCVSEQELRENCAFFKHGESTARSTLQLLCSLKRLKQVPSKKSEVTYVCLFGM